MHGPDANGSYGGLQGLGGLEAVYAHTSTGVSTGGWTGIVDDYYGHIIAHVNGEVVAESTVHWQRTRSLGYGPAPDSPVFYVSEGASVTQSAAWRGRRQDITGFYWLGARYYEPAGGRFLSPDPLGHAASLSLYDYAGGDPVNFVDPTGRSPSGQMDQTAGYRDKGFRFYEYAGVDRVSIGDILDYRNQLQQQSEQMGAYNTNRVTAFQLAHQTMLAHGGEAWSLLHSEHLMKMDPFMYMGYMSSGIEGALLQQHTAAAVFISSAAGLSGFLGAELLATYGAGIYQGAAAWTSNTLSMMRAVGFAGYLQSRGPQFWENGRMLFEEGVAMYAGVDTGPSAVSAYDLIGGWKNAAKTTAVADGRFYSTAFETTLSSTSYPGVSRYMHFKESNIALDSAISADIGLAESMRNLGISIPRSSSGSILGKSPEGWVWHHDTNAGVMQLVPKSQHPNIPGGIFWGTMHPGGNGGFSIWGK